MKFDEYYVGVYSGILCNTMKNQNEEASAKIQM